MGCRRRRDAAGLEASRASETDRAELLVAECANILWKKVRRDELSNEEAPVAARLLQSADIELSPTRMLLEPATRIAIDCMGVGLARSQSLTKFAAMMTEGLLC